MTKLRRRSRPFVALYWMDTYCGMIVGRFEITLVRSLWFWRHSIYWRTAYAGGTALLQVGPFIFTWVPR